MTDGIGPWTRERHRWQAAAAITIHSLATFTFGPTALPKFDSTAQSAYICKQPRSLLSVTLFFFSPCNPFTHSLSSLCLRRIMYSFFQLSPHVIRFGLRSSRLNAASIFRNPRGNTYLTRVRHFESIGLFVTQNTHVRNGYGFPISCSSVDIS